MKTLKMILVSFLFAFFSGCNGQTQKENASALSNKNKGEVAKTDTSNKPDINVKVNKQFDDKGNLIKYDSTYSYYYSGPKGPLRSGNDSVYSGFRSFFEKNYPDVISRHNRNIFFNDSLFKYDFFNDDYFQKRFELNEKMFENIYQQMDSIKRDYLKRTYPKGHQKKKIK
jgi:hypothetical protein